MADLEDPFRRHRPARERHAVYAAKARREDVGAARLSPDGKRGEAGGNADGGSRRRAAGYLAADEFRGLENLDGVFSQPGPSPPDLPADKPTGSGLRRHSSRWACRSI